MEQKAPPAGCQARSYTEAPAPALQRGGEKLNYTTQRTEGVQRVQSAEEPSLPEKARTTPWLPPLRKKAGIDHTSLPHESAQMCLRQFDLAGQKNEPRSLSHTPPLTHIPTPLRYRAVRGTFRSAGSPLITDGRTEEKNIHNNSQRGTVGQKLTCAELPGLGESFPE